MKWRSAAAEHAQELNKASQKNSTLLGILENPSAVHQQSGSLRSLLEAEQADELKLEAVETTSNLAPSCTRKKKYATYLNSHERNLIAQIQSAMSVFEDENSLRLVDRTDVGVYDALNMHLFYARRIVKFARSFPAFKCLPQEDQLCILKAFCFEFLSMRFAFIYDIEKDGHAVLAVSLSAKPNLDSKFSGIPLE